MKETIEKVKQKAKQLQQCAKGSHGWDHTERVYNLCMHIGKKEEADLDVLALAALLHDIARPIQDESKGDICHAQKGAEMAREILSEHNVEQDTIEKVVHCIQTHRFRKTLIPESKEAKVLFDSDKLDAIGAVGVGRAFLFAGEVGAILHKKNPDLSRDGEYALDDCAYREFLVKLQKVKDKILTEEAKRIARERHKFMLNFFERMNQECDGNV